MIGGYFAILILPLNANLEIASIKGAKPDARLSKRIIFYEHFAEHAQYGEQHLFFQPI